MKAACVTIPPMTRIVTLPVALLMGVGLCLYMIGLVIVRTPDQLFFEATQVSLAAAALAMAAGYLYPEQRVSLAVAMLLPMVIPAVFLFVRPFDIYGFWAALGQSVMWIVFFAATTAAVYAAAIAGSWVRHRFGPIQRISGYSISR